jgi:hypothetical protein
LPDLVRIAGELAHRKIGLESITEKIETVSSTGKLVFHVFAALAEFERNVIRERTLAGLKAARARGRSGGRPEKLSTKDKQQIRVLLKDPAVRVKEEDQEIEELYGRPQFNHDERLHFFSLSSEERALADAHYNLANRALFILQLGYFKARTLFFSFAFEEV